ncbi:MAG: hypothetical protein EP341_11360 [Sphingomonadales bacterium]|nr:MAG: hypothetical protein EP341_11360 [Sphingomonadales bacterium]
MTARGDIAKRIIAEIERDPFRTASEIGEAADATISYVATVSKRHGLRYGRPRKNITSAQLSDENKLWVTAQAKSLSITPGELINAVITDARIEEEGDDQ